MHIQRATGLYYASLKHEQCVIIISAIVRADSNRPARERADCYLRLRKLNRSLSRKIGSKKGEAKSYNFKKAQKRLSVLHAKAANIRNDETHKLTSMLAKDYSIIGIEDLSVSGMVKNHRLARSVLDMSFYEFRRQIEYKSKMTGSVVVIADRFYPSSKICSVCGNNLDKQIPLSIRAWYCPVCNAYHVRDHNAAINLKNNAVSYTVYACGETVETITSMKQELNVKTG